MRHAALGIGVLDQGPAADARSPLSSPGSTSTDSTEPVVGATIGLVMNGASKRSELASFLRVRRERLAPSSVGLPSGARRRTPGLRREEVAALAGVGVSWYTWLEQGRDIHVSEGVLERLSHALRLDHAERSHLFELAQGRSPRSRRDDVPVEVVSDMLQRTI